MATSGLLSKPELKSVSGFTSRALQRAWLEKEGIPHKLNGKDEIVVTWAHVNAWIEGRERPSVGRGINWAAV